MARAPHLSAIRCLLVWLGATLAAMTVWWAVGDTAIAVGRPTTWQGTFEDLVVTIAAVALLGCGGWLWLVTTVTVAQAIRGRVPNTSVGIVRRGVLIACGAVLLVGVGAPALAGGGHGGRLLAGLRMPDRASTSAPMPAVAPTPAARRTAANAHEVVVRAGDSLWSIAARALGTGAEPREVDAAWRALYAANRDVIGADPALIHPDQRLRPAPPHACDNN